MLLRKCNLCGNVHMSKQCSTIQTRFQWKYKASQVYLVGSWSNWLCKQQMNKKADNTFYLIKMILQGQYQYKFIVDGIWCHDQKTKYIPNKYGGFNNIVHVQLRSGVLEPESDFGQTETDEQNHKKSVLLKSFLPYSNLKIVGSWDNWQKKIPCIKYYSNLLKTNVNKVELILEQGNVYEFKFVYYGEYIHDPKLPVVPNDFGGLNNRIYIKHKHQQDSINKFRTWKWQKIQLNNPNFDRLSGHSICEIAGKIYIFGGRIKGQFSNEMYVLNEDNYEFFNLDTQNVPQQRGYCSTFVYGSKMILYGGINSMKYHQDYYSFNVSEKGMEWITTELTGVKPPPREKNSYVEFNDCLIIYGGYYASGDMETQIYYDDIYALNLKNLIWSSIQPQGKNPSGRYGHTASVIKGRMYVFGGLSQFGDLNEVVSINLDDGQKPKWRKQMFQGPYPAPRHGHTMTKWQKNLIIFGGRNQQKQIFNDLHILSLRNKQWVEIAITGPIPPPRYYHAWQKIKQNTEIIVFGGISLLGKNRHIYRLKPC